jgi:hypothetical protein
METSRSTNLNPEAIRKIGLRLYGAEKFQTDPATVILDTIAWVDAVLGNSETLLRQPMQNPVIQNLVSLVKAEGLVVIAERLKVGTSTLRNWVSGVCLPSRPNLEKIEKLLQDSQTTPTAGAEQPAAPGELFDQQQQPEPEATS